MPSRPARIASCCGLKVPYGLMCACQQRREAARKARHDRRRPSASARGYGGRWQAERTAFLATHPRCCRCPAPATVVDHVIPHKGDMVKFWDRQNWQPMCAACHNRTKQSEERRMCR